MEIRKEDLSKGIYKCISAEKLNLPLSQFYFRDRDHRSIGFKIDVSNSASEFFCKTFQLDNPEVFKEKLFQSISGDGGELAKNNALHSSSLCALLMFYNVSKKKPFYIEFDGKEHAYTNVYFEVKNKAVLDPFYSNMDVVLVNDETKEILFIECKFSEYLSCAKYELGKAYGDGKYNKIFKAINYDGKKVFQYGIKQLVAHYIGITNFIKGNYTDTDIANFYRKGTYSREDVYKEKYKNVAFMEVLFELPKKQFDEYKNETKEVFDYLKTLNTNIHFIGTTTYQNLFGGNENKNKEILSKLVKEFYKID